MNIGILRKIEECSPRENESRIERLKAGVFTFIYTVQKDKTGWLHGLRY